jgi:alkaline phosphatase D
MTYRLRFASLLIVLHVIGVPVRSEEPGHQPATRNVVLVTTDGLRWQEVFRGADASLLNKKDGGVADPESLRQAFWRETPEARREALMPFLWTTLARQGQIFGNRDKKSPAQVTNGRNFSYPGYNELFTGFPDPRINSNAKRPNPNVSVLEWLNRKPAFRGKVAAVASWDVYPFIFNVERSGLSVNAGWVPFGGPSLSESQILLNRRMSESVREWEDSRNDVFTFQVALEYFRRDTPRVFYVGFDDTDEYAHGGRYDQYLRAAHDVDAALKTLWDELQAHPQYRGTTTLIVTTDHGRGDPPQGWRSHGLIVAGSEAIWLAVVGPDTPALGERSETKTVTQSQVAATLAALLGENYNADVPQAAAPITEVVRPGGPAPAAAPTQPLRRVAFGSCASEARPQPIWDAVRATRPELLLMLGDNIYADTEDMDVMRAKYAQLAAMPGFKALRETIPILATWDDHDLGVDDGGSDYPKKVESQKIFLDFFGDRDDSPRRKRPGVYDARVFGPEGKRVQVIMLDTRYFRSPLKKKTHVTEGEGPYEPNPDPATTMLGADQWRWLEEQLRKPAEVRLIASSIQVVAEDHGWEKWMNLPHERERLYRLIRETGAEGVVFLSGDRHLAELSVMDGAAGYPFYDLTSSGLNAAAQSWRPQEVNRHRVATMNWGDNFGLITIDWDRPDPVISLQIRNVDGDVFLAQKLDLSTLQR